MANMQARSLNGIFPRELNIENVTGSRKFPSRFSKFHCVKHLEDLKAVYGGQCAHRRADDAKTSPLIEAP